MTAFINGMKVTKTESFILRHQNVSTPQYLQHPLTHPPLIIIDHQIDYEIICTIVRLDFIFCKYL